MSLIALPFSPEMAKAALEGRKCCTSRKTVKGAPGDEFEVEGVRFRLLDIHQLQIAEIALDYFRCEGFPDPSSCAAAIKAIYPDTRVNHWLTVHFFARCT